MRGDKGHQAHCRNARRSIRAPQPERGKSAQAPSEAPLNRIIIPLLLSLTLALPAYAAKGSTRSNEDTAEDLYSQGLRAMKRGYYTKALEKFNRVRNYHRDDPLSVKAQLAIADMHFKKSDYEQARFAYEEFSSYHPRHPDLDYVTYRIGLSIYKRAAKAAGRDQTATRGAVNVWTGFDTRFPESSYLEETARLLQKGRNRLAAKEMTVANFYADREAWGAVRGRTEYILRRYPDSQNKAEALGLLGRSLHAWGKVEAATSIRERLAAHAPDSKQLHGLDRVLAKPPGVRPDDKVFIRPYRIRGGTNPGAGS